MDHSFTSNMNIWIILLNLKHTFIADVEHLLFSTSKHT